MKRTDWILDSLYGVIPKKGMGWPTRVLVAFLACLVALGAVVFVADVIASVQPPTGDVNRDGRVNAADLTMMRRHVIGIYNLTPSQIRIGDVNHNGRIDQRDIDALVDIMLERPVRTYDEK